MKRGFFLAYAYVSQSSPSESLTGLYVLPHPLFRARRRVSCSVFLETSC